MQGAPGFNKCKKMFIWLELPKAKNSNPQSDQWLKLQSTSDSASGPPLLKEAIAGSRMETRKVAEEEEEARQKLLLCRCSSSFLQLLCLLQFGSQE